MLETKSKHILYRCNSTDVGISEILTLTLNTFTLLATFLCDDYYQYNIFFICFARIMQDNNISLFLDFSSFFYIYIVLDVFMF